MARSQRKRPTSCKRCGKPPKRGEVISYRGRCVDCAVAVMEHHNRAQSDPTSPEYEAVQRAAAEGMRRYAERVLAR